MRKALIICGSVWAVIIIFVAAGRLFNVWGLLIVLLSLLALTLALTGLDLSIYLRLRKISRDVLIGGDYAVSLDRLGKLAGWPLNSGEKRTFFLLEEFCYLYQGRLAEARETMEKIKSFRLSRRLRLTVVSLRKDYAIIAGDRALYEAADLEQKELTPQEGEDIALARRADLFYFDLLDGFVDRGRKDEMLKAYDEWGRHSRIERLFSDYVRLLVAKLGHAPLIGLDEFIREADGTFLKEKGLALKENKTAK